MRWLTGWAALGLGVVGLFIPFLQGILLMLVGMLLLAPYVPIFRTLRRKLLLRFPRLRQAMKSLRRRGRKKRHDPRVMP